MASGFPNLPGFTPNYPIDVIFLNIYFNRHNGLEE